MTLDLKSPQGIAAFKRLVAKADVVVENFRPDVKDRLGIDYESLKKINKRIVLTSHLRLRPGRALRQAPGLRPDRAGHGRADVDHRRCRAQGPVRVGIPVADLTAGLVCGARHAHRAARARNIRRRAVGVDLAAAGADFHARLPGRALAHRRRGRQAGRQQSSDLDPDRRVQDQGRPPQHRRHRAGDLGALLQCRRPSGMARAIRTTRPASCARKTATRSTPRSTRRRRRKPAPNGSTSSTRPACRAARSIRSTRCSPTRRSSISASRRKRRAPTAASSAWSASRSRCRARRARSRRAPPDLGEHTDEILKEFGFSADEIKALHEAKAV